LKAPEARAKSLTLGNECFALCLQIVRLSGEVDDLSFLVIDHLAELDDVVILSQLLVAHPSSCGNEISENAVILAAQSIVFTSHSLQFDNAGHACLFSCIMIGLSVHDLRIGSPQLQTEIRSCGCGPL
jgi:hypothetical protein